MYFGGPVGGWEVAEDLLMILVVEDDPLIQTLVEEQLTDGGFELAIATSGEEAVTLLKSANAKYRALVTAISQLLNSAQPPT